MLNKHHLGIYALIFNKAGNAILLIKKGRGPYKGMLDLPGGSLEDGEMLETALEREILEETGCRMTSCQQLCAESVLFEHIDEKTGQPARLRHVGILYRASTDDEPSVESDGLDSNGTIWLPLTDLANSNATPMVRLAFEAHHATRR